MRKCPFCKKKVRLDEYSLHQFSDDSTWVFNHYCNRFPAKLGVCITIYGESEEEIIAKWDGVYEEQTSESV